MSTELRRARRAFEEARRRYYTAIRKAYPINSHIVSFKHSAQGVPCRVLDHNHTDGIRVRSLLSDKVYWIDAYHIGGGQS